MRQLFAAQATPEQAETLSRQGLDITGAAAVEVRARSDGKVLWVNVNGVCVLRICQINNLQMEIEGREGVLFEQEGV